jgi:hypothetical protein
MLKVVGRERGRGGLSFCKFVDKKFVSPPEDQWTKTSHC